MSTAQQTYQRASAPGVSHARAFSRLVLAAVFYLLARFLAQRSALGFVSEDWAPLVGQAMLAFLLIVGYASFGFMLERQPHPVTQQGLKIRSGWFGEAGLGVALGWAIAVVCVLPMVLLGGIVLHFTLSTSSVNWLVADIAYFAFETLVVQVAFRGYPFECATRAVGELPGILIMATLYAILQAQLPGSSAASVMTSLALGLLLSLAFVRSRALWLPWGIQFGWVASRALLFGLPVEGVGSHSPIVQGDSIAPIALTGADFGLDGSWVSFLVLLVAMPLLYRATRELSFEYNAPVLVPGGIPVDLDAAARKQHDAATRPDVPELKPLVQILSVTEPAVNPFLASLPANPRSSPVENPSGRGTDENAETRHGLKDQLESD